MIKRYEPTVNCSEPEMREDANGDYVSFEDATKDSDQMYLTGINDAHSWAKRWGYEDFAERLIKEVNERAHRSGLPEFRP